MCAKNYLNVKRFDKVNAKTKGCDFLRQSVGDVIFAIPYYSYYLPSDAFSIKLVYFCLRNSENIWSNTVVLDS